jgi:flagellar assembly protein FliH
MGKVISTDKLSEHSIKKFEFASLEVDEEKTTFDKTLFSNSSMKEDTSTTVESSTKQREEEKEVTIEGDELLEKIDALTSQNVTLEMELETLKKEFDEKIHEATESAYKKGHEEGIKETQETLQEHNDDLNIQLLKSITTLDETVQKLDTFLNSIEEDLVEASSIIAKKIIKKELEEHSHEVAINLAKTFIQDLKEASSITLKVNPNDASYIQEHFKTEKNIKIDADDAINKGGIIILSDIGNIDGNIQTRVEKAMALIEREG